MTELGILPLKLKRAILIKDTQAQAGNFEEKTLKLKPATLKKRHSSSSRQLQAKRKEGIEKS
jgi:hypothetical protein